MKDWQHHVRRTRVGETNTAWCGQQVFGFDWCFMSVDHALHSIQLGDRMVPCPACAKAMIEQLQRAIDIDRDA
jgi:hypothetical protein